MVVHNLEVYTAQTYADGTAVDPATESQEFENWVANHQERLGAQRSGFSAGSTDETEGEGVDYYQGSWRFDYSHDRGALLTPLRALIQNTYTWTVIRWHECDHDEDARGGCSWDTKWEYPDVGTPPAEIRQMLNLDEIPEGPPP